MMNGVRSAVQNVIGNHSVISLNPLDRRRLA
jgi:hypothetical protein